MGYIPPAVVRGVPETLRVTQVTVLAPSCLQSLLVRLLLKAHFSHRKWKDHGSFLLSFCHSIRRCCGGCWGRGGHQQSHSAVIPMSYNNDWYDKIRPWVLYWQKCYGGSQPCSDWMEEPFHMPGTVNLARNPSWGAHGPKGWTPLVFDKLTKHQTSV